MNPYFKTDRGVLYCGDSLEILPQLKEKADLCLTDPPYSHNNGGGGRNFIGNKKHFQALEDNDLNSFNPMKFLSIWYNYNKNNHSYIFCSKDLINQYINFFVAQKIKWDLLIMNKNNPVPTKNNKYLSDVEYVFFTRGKGCYFNNNAEYDLYRKVQRINVKPSEFGHPTEKQVPHLEKYLIISSKENDLIIDPFGGSGATALACENLHRRWIMIEKEPKYCEIIKKRLEQHLKQVTLLDMME